MGFAKTATAVTCACFAGIALGACGGSGGLLSQTQASSLRGDLQTASSALANSRCSTAQSAVRSFNDQVDGLNGTNATLVANLRQGASEISSLITKQCATHVPTTPIKTQTQPTTSTPTQTQPTTTTSSSGGAGIGG